MHDGNTPDDHGPPARADALRHAWTEVHGPLNAAAEDLLEQNPGYFERVLDFTAHPGATARSSRRSRR